MSKTKNNIVSASVNDELMNRLIDYKNKTNNKNLSSTLREVAQRFFTDYEFIEASKKMTKEFDRMIGSVNQQEERIFEMAEELKSVKDDSMNQWRGSAEGLNILAQNLQAIQKQFSQLNIIISNQNNVIERIVKLSPLVALWATGQITKEKFDSAKNLVWASLDSATEKKEDTSGLKTQPVRQVEQDLGMGR